MPIYGRFHQLAPAHYEDYICFQDFMEYCSEHLDTRTYAMALPPADPQIVDGVMRFLDEGVSAPKDKLPGILEKIWLLIKKLIKNPSSAIQFFKTVYKYASKYWRIQEDDIAAFVKTADGNFSWYKVVYT